MALASISDQRSDWIPMRKLTKEKPGRNPEIPRRIIISSFCRGIMGRFRLRVFLSNGLAKGSFIQNVSRFISPICPVSRRRGQLREDVSEFYFTFSVAVLLETPISRAISADLGFTAWEVNEIELFYSWRSCPKKFLYAIARGTA